MEAAVAGQRQLILLQLVPGFTNIHPILLESNRDERMICKVAKSYRMQSRYSCPVVCCTLLVLCYALLLEMERPQSQHFSLYLRHQSPVFSSCEIERNWSPLTRHKSCDCPTYNCPHKNLQVCNSAVHSCFAEPFNEKLPTVSNTARAKQLLRRKTAVQTFSSCLFTVRKCLNLHMKSSQPMT